MKKLLIISVMSLLLCGCISYNATHVQANGGYAHIMPITGNLVLGYGNFSVMHMNTAIGQGMHFKSTQYGLTTTNALYTEEMHIIPMSDGQVVVTKEQKPLISILGIRIDNPFSNPVATLEFIPSENTTN
jgi:hypothetical protein